MKITDSVWFTQMGQQYSYGMVFGVTPEGVHKIYIGVGQGNSRTVDEQNIAETGAHIYESHARSILDHLAKNKK